jgi:hypothetical protein
MSYQRLGRKDQARAALERLLETNKNPGRGGEETQGLLREARAVVEGE